MNSICLNKTQILSFNFVEDINNINYKNKSESEDSLNTRVESVSKRKLEELDRLSIKDKFETEEPASKKQKIKPLRPASTRTRKEPDRLSIEKEPVRKRQKREPSSDNDNVPTVREFKQMGSPVKYYKVTHDKQGMPRILLTPTKDKQRRQEARDARAGVVRNKMYLYVFKNDLGQKYIGIGNRVFLRLIQHCQPNPKSLIDRALWDQSERQWKCGIYDYTVKVNKLVLVHRKGKKAKYMRAISLAEQRAIKAHNTLFRLDKNKKNIGGLNDHIGGSGRIPGTKNKKSKVGKPKAQRSLKF